MSSDSLTILLNDGAGGFAFGPTIPVGSRPRGVATADFNGYDKPDIAVAIAGDGVIQVLTNDLRGFGFIEEPVIVVGKEPSTINPYDPDQDKDMDILGGNEGDDTVSLIYNGDEGFDPPTSAPVGDEPVQVTSGDLDGDGFPEIVTVDRSGNTLSVLINDGTGQFEESVLLPVGDSPRSIVLIDADGDDAKDLDIVIVSNGTEGTRVVQLIRNDTEVPGQLVFAPIEDIDAGEDPLFVLADDVDGNGKDDIITVTPSGPRGRGGTITVLLNKSGPACNADWDGNEVTDESDLIAFIEAWNADMANGTTFTDLDDNGVVNSTDVALFVNFYFQSPLRCFG
jgi:hypothetical protein